MKPLAFIKNMLNHLGEELVLSEKVEIFEARSIDYIKQYLEFVPEWTVKKGQ
jgi:hypothetical protein